MKAIVRLAVLMLMLITAGIASAQKEFVQRFFLDKPVTAGPLKVFPSLDDPNVYYYLPNKLRLGTNEQGQPQFSFIKYVENVRSGSGEKEATVGNGGGYVWLMVGLNVTDEEKAQAQQELMRINPRGKIVSPVVYRSGVMSLVTKSMANEGGNKVIGMGPAPVLESDKIAVSFVLNKADATLLWETLKGPTPDISINAVMIISGYQSPVEFKIEIDWDKVYKHKNFTLAAKTPIIGAEISSMVQDLKETGAITITAIGEDPNVQKLQEILVNKMISECFQPFGSQGGVNWTELGKPDNTGRSFFDKTSDQLNAKNKAANEDTKKASPGTSLPAKSSPTSPTATKPPVAEAATAPKTVPAVPKKVTGGDTIGGQTTSTGTRPAKEAAATDKPLNAGTKPDAKTPAKKDEKSVPLIQIMGSYQQKTIRQTGKYTANAKQYFTTILTEPFGMNIGAINCAGCLRQVNLDDPLYKQREIVAWIDGSTADDFNKYINYVTVSMQKKHPAGDITTDEVRIDSKNFSKQGNNFKLMYGWMEGDNDRRTWLDYKYRAVWSFFGGGKIEQDWQESNEPVIPLAAPVERIVINVMADSARLAKADIRAVTTRIFYKITENSQEQVKQVTLNPAKRIFSTVEEIMLPKNAFNFDYQVEWLLNTNEDIKSARRTSSSPDLYVDVITK
jgi:hypothetical protein